MPFRLLTVVVLALSTAIFFNSNVANSSETASASTRILTAEDVETICKARGIADRKYKHRYAMCKKRNNNAIGKPISKVNERTLARIQRATGASNPTPATAQ